MGSGPYHEQLGYNYRLGEMSAALGLAQLRRIEVLLGRRNKVAARYGELLRTTPGAAPCASSLPRRA